MFLNTERLKELKDNFAGKRIAVIGDMMLDSYFWGVVKRISPEAPVPVVEIDDEFFRFGGAANVALNIASLGGIPLPVGIIGNDNDGKIFRQLVSDNGIDSEGILIDETRPTTAKSRVIAAHQHIVRIDKESKEYLTEESENKILDFLRRKIDSIDAIILQDYNKGVLTEKIIRESIRLAKEYGKIVTVDPKFLNFLEYKNVTLFKPNRKETEDALGIRINSEEEIEKAGRNLLEKLNSEYVLLTLGEKGIALFQKDKKTFTLPTEARKAADVSGAGDTVISTITMALCAGAGIEEAAYLANYAGGLVCEVTGIVPIEIDNLFDTIAGRINRK